MLKAGKINPTIGTKIDGKKADAIFCLNKIVNLYLYNLISNKINY